MKTFTNEATVNYNGITLNSNEVTGFILDQIIITKVAVKNVYSENENIVYIVTARNTTSKDIGGLSLKDDLGMYKDGYKYRVPLTYVDETLKYYVNGELVCKKTPFSKSPFMVTGLTIPAGGNIVLVYETHINEYAKLGEKDYITNTAEIFNYEYNVECQETVRTANVPILSIIKSLNPTFIKKDREITYTFIIENRGNTKAGKDADIVLEDTFNPQLKNIKVTLNNQCLTFKKDYDYNAVTGEFKTTKGLITVPSAQFKTDLQGRTVVKPGKTVVQVTGIVI